MSPMLSIDGTDVRIARPSEYSHPKWGDFGRAFSGKLRSDFRADHRAFRITTAELTAAERDTLIGILRGDPPLTFSGDLVGSPSVDCHVEPGSVRVQPLTDDAFIVSFEAHETAATP